MELTLDEALQQGIKAHKEGKLQDAERLYRAILQVQPDHPDANHNLGVLAVAVGKPLEAMPLFKLALGANPQIEQFWLSYIDVLIRLERFRDVEQILADAQKAGVSSGKLDVIHQQFQQASQRIDNDVREGIALSETGVQLADKKKNGGDTEGDAQPDSAPSQDQVASVLGHYQSGSFTEAESLALSLTVEFPAHSFGWKVLGALLKQAGKVSEALLPMRKAVELSPHDAAAHSNLGLTLGALRRLDEAEASLKEAIALKPDFAEAYYNLGNTLRELGRLEEAEASYRQATVIRPDYARAYSNLGLAVRALGRADEAEEILREVVVLQPESVGSHSNLADTLRALGRLDEAEASYRQAISLKPDFAEAHSNLGFTLQQLGKLDGAEASYRQVIALKPDSAEAHNNLGNVLNKLGRSSEAEDSYRQAIALNPDFTEAHYNLGNLLQKLGRSGEAEVSYRRAIALNPDLTEAHSNLGALLKGLGKVGEAEASYRTAIALKPDHAEAHSNLGALLTELGRLAEAEQSLRQAIAIKPHCPEAQNNLGATLQKLGRLEAAAECYRQAALLNPAAGNAVHMLSALTGENTARAPLDYVENLFDRYAAEFDSSLVDQLDYQIPKVIAELIKQNNKNDNLGSILDLGCGTGLFGIEVSQVCNRLDGLDISANMLRKAEERGVYDQLIKQDIESYLSNETLDFDYFVATDVFVYIGELADIFESIQSRNILSGRLVFSVEHKDGNDFALLPSGRYAHSKPYIEGLCSRFQYQLEHFETQNLRLDKGSYILGGLYLLSF